MQARLHLPVLFIFLLYGKAAFSQSKEVKFLIDTCIMMMKDQSVNAGNVDWRRVHTTALNKAAGINDPYQLGDVMRYIFQSANDFHGAFFYKDSTFKWNRKERPVPDSVMNEWKKGVYVKGLVLDNNVGYLRVPYMSFNGKDDADNNAQKLNDSLCYLLQHGVKGIVLDVRLNGGGAMHPMMLGLEQLLDTGNIGSFVSRKNQDWIIRNHTFLLDTAIVTSLRLPCAVSAAQLPVVVLMGNNTGSSGEFLVMAFKGRKNTLLLGSETAGYITAVGGFAINDAAYVYLSTGYGKDRLGNVYKKAIQPDRLMDGPDSFNNIPGDKKVKAAAGWIIHAIEK